jgi:hypothetical protein
MIGDDHTRIHPTTGTENPFASFPTAAMLSAYHLGLSSRPNQYE